MKKLGWLIGACALLGTTAASAEPGKLGIGYQQTLGGVRGIATHYRLGPSMSLSSAVGLSIDNPEQTGADSTTQFQLAAGLIYDLFQGERVNVGIGGHIDLGWASSGDASATQVNLDVPLRTQLWVTNEIALTFDLGLVITMVGDDGAVLSPTAFGTSGAKGFGIGEGLNIVANGGFAWYF